ncbi:MAG: MFS transporter [Promethearchaeati archaeon SRVP18_Atabeyarchaeia-1]
MSLSRKRKVGFGLTNFGSLMAPQAVGMYLIWNYVHGTVLGKSQTGILLVGIALLIFTIWDASNDPLIGQWSDKTRTRWGRRKPFIIFGVPFLAIFYYLLWNPIASTDVFVMFIILVVLLCVYDTFLTMSTLWYAMYPEISTSMSDRLEISSYLQVFGILGLAFAYAVPSLLVGMGYGWDKIALMLCVIILVSFYMPVISVREHPEFSLDKPLPFGQALSKSVRNRSFLTYLGTQLTLQLTYSIAVATIPFYVNDVLGGNLFMLLLIMFASILLSLFVWVKFSQRSGPRKALSVSIVILMIALFMTLFITETIEAILVLIIAGIGLAGPMLIPTMMLADVCDEDELKTDARREGMYTGISGFIVKLSTSVSGLIVTGVLAFSGYISGTTVQPASAVLGIRMLMGLITLVPLVLGLIVLSKYPLVGGTLTRLKKDVETLHLEKAKRLAKH